MFNCIRQIRRKCKIDDTLEVTRWSQVRTFTAEGGPWVTVPEATTSLCLPHTINDWRCSLRASQVENTTTCPEAHSPLWTVRLYTKPETNWLRFEKMCFQVLISNGLVHFQHKGQGRGGGVNLTQITTMFLTDHSVSLYHIARCAFHRSQFGWFTVSRCQSIQEATQSQVRFQN